MTALNGLNIIAHGEAMGTRSKFNEPLKLLNINNPQGENHGKNNYVKSLVIFDP